MRRLLRPRAFRLLLRVLGPPVLLVLLAWTCQSFRRATIRSLFADGPRGPAPVLSQPRGLQPGLPPVSRVRVVLLDGLGLAPARRLPALGAACAGGVDMVLDVGFPTVSLPVQNVLWTGLAQMQSGILYRVTARVPPTPDALPIRVPGSVAVAESHNEIAASFGFANMFAPVGAKAVSDADAEWKRVGFADAADAALSSSAPLVFVHVLRIDEAGHLEGAASARYALAAQQADAMLARWLASSAAAPDQADTRWFVLSDHGHRAAGGHADAEPDVRLVRGCMFGAGVERAFLDEPIHLVDLHRALADSLGVAPQAAAVGRPLPFAIQHPDVGATLPRPSRTRAAVAALVLLAGVAVTAFAMGARVGLFPLWPLVAIGSVIALSGDVTLSNPIVYPPLGVTAARALSPGLVVLAVQALIVLLRRASWRLVASALALPLSILLAAAVLSAAVDVFFGWRAPPPLMPTWTAVTCVAATACAAASLILAAVSLVGRIITAMRGPSRRTVPGHAAAGGAVD